MNTGMISKRYARALLQYAVGQKAEDTVFSEMKKLAASFAREPKLRVAMDNPMLSTETKFNLALAAIGGQASEQYQRFIQFILDKKRENHLRSMALSYKDLYCELKNINTGRLVTAAEIDKATTEKLKALSQVIKPGQLDFETAVDPKIDGGFILYIDTFRLDASIKTQLNKIKQNLINENSKIS